MSYKEKNREDANNSNVQATPGGETAQVPRRVDVLFGLTPRKIHLMLDDYFAQVTGYARALNELIEEAGRLKDLELDENAVIALSRTLGVVAEFVGFNAAELARFATPIGVLFKLEKAKEAYDNFAGKLPASCDEPTWKLSLTDVEEKRAARDLHAMLLPVATGVEKAGFREFTLTTLWAMRHAKTRWARENMTRALVAAQAIYLEYDGNAKPFMSMHDLYNPPVEEGKKRRKGGRHV